MNDLITTQINIFIDSKGMETKHEYGIWREIVQLILL